MTSTVVLKFGGTSLASHEDFRRIAADLAERSEQIVVVVSAQAGMTDALLAQMDGLTDAPPTHALDALVVTGEQQSASLMAAALTAAGRPAEVVPPWRVFETDGTFGDADIDDVNLEPIQERLRSGITPVVAGFTGCAPDGRLCTLGRGGSDYSAVALGAALKSPVELCKADTDGIYDCDPNTNPGATRFDTLTHDEAYQLASRGAKVLHDKAAGVARDAQVRVLVRNTSTGTTGTWIVPEDAPPVVPAVAR